MTRKLASIGMPTSWPGYIVGVAALLTLGSPLVAEAAPYINSSQLLHHCLADTAMDQGICLGYVAAVADQTIARGDCDHPPTSLDDAMGRVIAFLEDEPVYRGVTPAQAVEAAVCE